jgi:large subunit ribosomal protein L21
MSTKEFAVIKTGGKQYKVSVGDVLRIEKLPKEYEEGDKVTFEEVLLFDNGKDTNVGTPTLEGKTVEALFQEEGRAKKVVVAKYKSKSRYYRKNGHRQPFYEVKISAIK